MLTSRPPVFTNLLFSRPPVFTNLLKSSSPLSRTQGDLEFTARYTGLNMAWMTTDEKIVHVQSNLDFCRDMQISQPGNTYYRSRVRALYSELRYLRSLANQPTIQQPLAQPGTQQTQAQAQPQTRSIPIQSLLNESASVFIATIRLNLSSFVRGMIMYLRPFFSAIIPFVLAALLPLVLDYLPLIKEVYTKLVNILGEHLIIISMLFSVLYFLFKLLLVIRRANNSIGRYDRFFNFAANHYSSGILYFFILLLSVGLVYLCVCDCNCVCDCVCGCTISCDAPRA